MHLPRSSAFRPPWKGVPSRHMRYVITAGFLAKATLAFCIPPDWELPPPALQGAALDRHGQDDMGGL